MAGIAGPLHLISPSGTQDIYNSTTNISAADNYTQANVKESIPKSIWVVYTVPNFDDGNADYNSATIVYPDAPTVNTMSPIQSAQGFNVKNPGAILFKYNLFRGFGSQTSSSIEDLTSSFPEGVSSIIITGGIWNLFSGINFTGKKLAFDGVEDLDFGEYDFGFLPENEQPKSMKYVRESR